jgi:hypothetical protein
MQHSQQLSKRKFDFNTCSIKKENIKVFKTEHDQKQIKILHEIEKNPITKLITSYDKFKHETKNQNDRILFFIYLISLIALRMITEHLPETKSLNMILHSYASFKHVQNLLISFFLLHISLAFFSILLHNYNSFLFVCSTPE